jgi:Ca2+-binding RTX toxin-like protein
VATITGTNGNDDLIGTDEADTFHPLAGSDTVDGLDGSDTLVLDYSDYGLLDPFAGAAVPDMHLSQVLSSGGSFVGDIRVAYGSDSVSFQSIEHLRLVLTRFNDLFILDGSAIAQGATISIDAGGGSHDRLEAALFDLDSVYLSVTPGGTTASFGTLANFEEFRLNLTFGADNVTTGNGMDTLDGNEGDDSLNGGGGIDHVEGGGGDDTLHGGADNDHVNGGGGNDQLYGDDGSDWIVAGTGLDAVDGGTGADTLVLQWGDWTRTVYTQALVLGANGYSGGYADDNPGGPAQRSVSFTAVEQFEIATGSGNDLITTGNGNDVVSSGAGNDKVDVGAGVDRANGGSGQDVISADLSAATSGVFYNLVTGSFTSPFLNSFTNFEGFGRFRTGLGNDELVTTSLDIDETIETGAGNDKVTVRNGSDVVAGGDGIDTLVVDYSAAADSVVTAYLQTVPWGTLETGYNGRILVMGGGAQVDYSGIERFEITATGPGGANIETGRGNDRIVTGGAFDWIAPGGGDDYVDAGGGAHDLVSYRQSYPEREAGTVGVIVNLSAVAYVIHAGHALAGGTVASNEAIDNWGGRDTLVSVEGASGGGQDDVLLGNDLHNNFYGEGGNDRIVGGAGSDYISAGEGIDLVDYSAETGTLAVFVNLDSSTVYMGLAPERARDSFGNLDILLDVEQVTGTALNDFVQGNGSANRISLGAGGDEALGLAGDDLLIGAEGNDRLEGGSGNDRLEGGEGNDLLLGDSGDDSIEGGGGDDEIYAMEGNDVLLGGAGTDVIGGGDGDDDIQGGDGGDSLFGEAGVDSIAGGAGNDFIEGGEADDVLTGGAGNDILRGGAGIDSLDGGDNDGIFFDGYGDRVSFHELSATQGVLADLRTGIISNDGFGNVETMTGIESLGAGTAFADTFHGSDSINFLYGSRGDSLHGHGADDLLALKAAAALVDGGAGVDQLQLYVLSNVLLPDSNGDGLAEYAPEMASGWTVHLAAGTLRDGYGNVGTVVAIEDLVGSHLRDELRGSAVANRIDGGAGNDLLLVQDGGDDTALGGEGNDILYFGAALSAGDVADGGAGRDALVLQGNVTAVLSETNLAGIESISIQSGATTRFGDTANNLYDYDLTTADGNVAAGVQLIVNAQSLRAGEDFTFDGSAESDGRFLVYGGHGVDDLTGGDGADAFFFEGQRWGADDKVNGGDGRDALVISGGSGMTHIEFAADALTGIESISLNNRFATDPTQKPSYELVLNNGNVAAGATLIVNGSSIPGGQQVIIDGRGVHGGNLILFAGGGHDVLTGGDGADLIVGGGGADSLTGGAGADTFRYDAASDSIGLADLIGDFQSGLDRIDLSRIDADTIAGGNQAFSWIGSNAFSGSAGELRTYEADGYRLVEGDTDGNGLADFVIGFQIGTPPLVQGDFLL